MTRGFFLLLLTLVVWLQIPCGFAEEVAKSNPRLVLTLAEKEWLQSHPALRFTGDPDWLPFEAFNKRGVYQGIVADHLDLFEQRLGVQFERISTKNWSESIQKAMDYEVDVISESPGSIITPKFLFSEPYLSSPIVFMMSIKSQRVSGFETLRGKRVALVKDYGYAQDILKAYPDYPFIFVESVREGLEKVATGDLDALACTLALGSYLAGELNLHNISVSGTTEFSMQLSLAIRKDWPTLHSIVNKVIRSVSVEERNRIMSQWVRVIQQNQRLNLPEKIEFSQVNFILKYLFLMFSLILTTLIAMWFFKGRPTHLSIRQTLFIAFFVFAGLIVSIGAFITMLLEEEEKRIKIEQLYIASQSLVLELKQSSDDLTRFSRAFAATEDQIYWDYFKTIIIFCKIVINYILWSISKCPRSICTIFWN